MISSVVTNGGKLRPWEAIGMSRASWYRHGKPTKKPEPRQTQKDIAEVLGVSVRTVQRDLAEKRKEERRARLARVDEYMAQGYSQDDACSLTAAELRACAIETLLSEKDGLVRFAQRLNISPNVTQPRDGHDRAGGEKQTAHGDAVPPRGMRIQTIHARLRETVDASNKPRC
jgi:uncharacterized protein YoaH (UPF0181 family)